MIKLLASCKCGLIKAIDDVEHDFLIINDLSYKCIKCKKIFCSENTKKRYKEKIHPKEPDSIMQEIVDNICNTHNEKYIAFCKTCDKDICQKCIEGEKDHNNY